MRVLVPFIAGVLVSLVVAVGVSGDLPDVGSAVVDALPGGPDRGFCIERDGREWCEWLEPPPGGSVCDIDYFGTGEYRRVLMACD